MQQTRTLVIISLCAGMAWCLVGCGGYTDENIETQVITDEMINERYPDGIPTLPGIPASPDEQSKADAPKGEAP